MDERGMRRPIAFCLVALLLLISIGIFIPGVTASVQDNKLVVLEYHPYPDIEDPFGIEAGDKRMRSYYGADDFPTTVFDGVLTFGGANDSSIYKDKYRPAILERLSVDTPITIELRGDLTQDAGTMEIDIRSSSDLGGTALSVRAAVIDNNNFFLGSNGVDNHRFVVREYYEISVVNFSVDLEEHFEKSFTINSSWKFEDLGIVAFVQVENDVPSLGLKTKEVLQSALYWFGQKAPTIQSSRAVLIEMYTASWCPPCKFGDGAVDQAAAEFQSSFTEPERQGPDHDITSIIAIGLVVVSIAVIVIIYVEFSGRKGPGRPAKRSRKMLEEHRTRSEEE